MNIYIKLLNFVVDLILPLIVGYMIGHFTRVTSKKLDKLMYLNLFIVFPFMGFLSAWGLNLSKEILLVPFIGVISLLLAGVVAYFASKLKKQPPLDQGSYFLATMLSNRGTIGGISVFILFGEAGYAIANVSVMLNSFVIFGICYPIAQYFRGQHLEESSRISILSILFNKKMIPVLGLFIGLTLNILSINRPIVASSIFPYLVHLSAWLALVPIGGLIDFSEMKQYFRKVTDIIAVKFLIIPLVTFLFTLLVVDDPLIIKVITIVSATPTAINAVIATRINKLNIHLSTASFVMTTLIYLIVIYPIILLVL